MHQGRRAATLLGLLALALLLGAGGLGWRLGGARIELEQARQRWEARPFRNYRIEVEQRLGTSCRYAVEVRDERITSVTYNSCSQLIWWRDLPVLPMGALFTRLATAAGTCGPDGCRCDGVVLLAADYDPALGYPRTAQLRAEPTMRWLHPAYWRELASPPRPCSRSYVELDLKVVSLTPLP
jgi:Family of unknown function (DUF6174)